MNIFNVHIYSLDRVREKLISEYLILKLVCERSFQAGRASVPIKYSLLSVC